MGKGIRNANLEIPIKEHVFIVCAAIWYNDGKVYEDQPLNIDTGYILCGRRHNNIRSIRQQLLNLKTKNKDIEGFLTSDDRFVNRSKAAEIAYASCQISKETGSLNSEALY